MTDHPRDSSDLATQCRCEMAGLSLGSVRRWQLTRQENMHEARKCKAFLMDPNGYWKYSAGDERLKRAVSFWVNKAKHCHAIAIGRKPLIKDMVITSATGSYVGPVYATKH